MSTTQKTSNTMLQKPSNTMYQRLKNYASTLKDNEEYSDKQALCIAKFIEDFESHDRKTKPVNVLYFGKYKNEVIDDVMKLKTGRNYLFWLVRQGFWLSKPDNVPTTKYIYTFDPDTGNKINMNED